jgi:ADP-heptose:LPS heptosyltransferase
VSARGLLPNVRRIAVLRANALGDLIFALPALSALRAAYPSAEIVLLGRAWHASFFAGRPGPVDGVLVVPGDDAPGSAPGGMHSDAPWRAATNAERAAFARRARHEGFDLAVQIHGGGRNSNPFIASLGARWTVGLRSEDAAPLDRWVRFVYYQQEVLRCLEVVGLVGAAPLDLEPKLALQAADTAEAAVALAGVKPPFVVLHPGANDPRRRWPSDRFGQVGDALAEAGLSLVVTGSREELPLADELIGALHLPARNLAGRTTLGGLAGVLASARLVISNDSGPLHLAAALGRPTVGVYWCGNLINGGPLTRHRHRPLIAWQVSCPRCGAPCTGGRCPHDDSFVTEIRVESVLDAAHDLLDLPDTPHAQGPIVARGLHIGLEDHAQQGRSLHADQQHQSEERHHGGSSIHGRARAAVRVDETSQMDPFDG